MTKGPISNKKKLAMGKSPVVGKSTAVKMKTGGAVKGKEVKVKHVAMKTGGMVAKEKSSPASMTKKMKSC